MEKETKHTPEATLKLELKTNAHPNVDRSPWGWVKVDGTRINIGTWSGVRERDMWERIVTAVNSHDSLQTELSEMKKEREELIELFEKISNPIMYLSEQAIKTGASLNGQIAIQLSNDPNWLREIAKSALSRIKKVKPY